jgi:hypothetical protein
MTQAVDLVCGRREVLRNRGLLTLVSQLVAGLPERLHNTA